MSVKADDVAPSRETSTGHPLPGLLLTMMLWGSGFVSSKLLVGDVSYDVAAVLRFGSGSIILLCAVPLRERAGISRREVASLAAAGGVGVFLYNGLLFYGLSKAPAADGSIVVPVLSPILTAAAAMLLRWEKVRGHRIAGVALGAAGAALFFLAATDSGGGQRAVGELAYAWAAVSWAAYTMVGKQILEHIEPVRATAYSMAFGSLLLSLLAAPHIGAVSWAHLSRGFWGTLAYVVLGPTVVAHTLFYRGVRRVGPTAASTLMFIVPVSGTVLSWLLLGESFGPGRVIGSLLMLTGAMIAVVRPKFPLPQWRRSPGRVARTQTSSPRR